MKRMNPVTNMPFIIGDVREDGHIFKTYELTHTKKNGFFKEKWLSPSAFEKFRQTDRRTTSNWQQNNRDKSNAKEAKYRASKSRRMPHWITEDHMKAIRSIYSQAKEMTQQTGIVHHVDHIVPLRGVNVSGLHVPWNLQILSMSENCSKSNRFNPMLSG